MSEWGELEGIKITGDPEIPQNKVNIQRKNKQKYPSKQGESQHSHSCRHLTPVLADLV